ncbi:MAG: hypothetical protein WBM59_03475, partial [Sedimenticolaceae bacterium]
MLRQQLDATLARLANDFAFVANAIRAGNSWHPSGCSGPAFASATFGLTARLPGSRLAQDLP